MRAGNAWQWMAIGVASGVIMVALAACRSGSNGPDGGSGGRGGNGGGSAVVAGSDTTPSGLREALVDVRVNDPATGDMHTVGSGVVDSATGLVVTTVGNLEAAQMIRVKLFDGAQRRAWLRLVDPVSLIAVLELEGEHPAGLVPIDAYPEDAGVTYRAVPLDREQWQASVPSASIEVRTLAAEADADWPWYRTLAADEAVPVSALIVDDRNRLAGMVTDVYDGPEGVEVGCVPGPAIAELVRHAAERGRWTDSSLEDGDLRWIELWGFDVDGTFDDTNMWGIDAVRAAVYADRPAVLEALGNAGAAIDQPDAYGATPLMLAVVADQPATVTVLLAAGANPNRADIDGATAMSVAVMYGSADVLERLIEHDGDVNAVAAGMPLIGLAADRGDHDIADALLRRGADVNARAEGDGATPLMIAASADNEPLVELLLARGANVHTEDAFGATALHYAAMFGTHQIGRLLLDAGARATAQCDEGLQPIDYARERPDADLWIEVFKRSDAAHPMLPF